MFMAMTPEENERVEGIEDALQKIDKRLSSIYNIMVTNPDFPDAPPGLTTRVTNIEKEQREQRKILDGFQLFIDSIKKDWKKSLLIFIIGIVISAIIFGVISLADAAGIIKFFK